MGQIQSEYINSGKVRFAYRHFPLNFHANAWKAAEASECANEQGKFWQMHDKLFQNQSSWSGQSSNDALSSFTNYASQIGMSTDQFNACLTSGKYAGKVQEDLSAAQSLGVTGTPGFYINNQSLVGAQPYQNFKTVIDQELAR